MFGGRAWPLGVVLLVACVQPIPLENRACPCLETEYRCCQAANLCVRKELACPTTGGGIDEPPPVPGADASVRADPDVAFPPPPDAAAPPPRDAPAPPPPDAAAPPPPDAAAPPPPDAATPAPPRWQTLGDSGLPQTRALNFDLRVADDGTPVLIISKHTPPGRARVTIALRYDGSAWQQLGGDLPGSEFPPAALLTGDGIPYVLVGGVVYQLQQGSWRALPAPPPTSFLSPSLPLSLARDEQGRLYAFARSNADTTQLGVMRFSGGSWQLLGRADSFSRTPRVPELQLAADGDTPFVALRATDTSEIDVRRWTGSDWVAVGGETISFFDCSFLVAPGGIVYLASDPSGGIQMKRASGAQPWMDLPTLETVRGVFGALPALAVGSEGTLYVAYGADRAAGPDVVPGPLVTRLVGDSFVDLPVEGLDPSVFDSIKLRIVRRPGAAGGEAVFLAYSRAAQLVVKRLER